MSILDKTHLKTEIFESREKLEQSLCKETSRSSIATIKWNNYWIASIKLYSYCMVIEIFYRHALAAWHIPGRGHQLANTVNDRCLFELIKS